MAIHLEKAIQFVECNGNIFQRNYLRSLFGAKNLEVTLGKLAPYQNTDGGWIKIDPDYTGNVSSINCTMAGLGKLERLHVDISSLIDRSIEFLKKNQKINGMWDESNEIIDFQPPHWYYPRFTNNRIWFTNGILRYVISRKPKEQEMIGKARRYLRQFWDGKKFPGYDHNNWMGIVSFQNGDGPRDQEIRQGCLENLRREIRGYDLADVIWTLESCCFLQLPQREEAVANGLEVLMAGQAEDGGFCTGYGEFQRADITIEALDSLANYGVIPRCFELPSLYLEGSKTNGI